MCVASENIVPNTQEMSLPANEGFDSSCRRPSQTHTTQGGPGLNEEGGGDLVSPVGTVDSCMCPLERQHPSPVAHLIYVLGVPPSQSVPPSQAGLMAPCMLCVNPAPTWGLFYNHRSRCEHAIPASHATHTTGQSQKISKSHLLHSEIKGHLKIQVASGLVCSGGHSKVPCTGLLTAKTQLLAPLETRCPNQGPHWFLPRPGSLACRWLSPPRVATGPSLCICLCPSLLSLQGHQSDWVRMHPKNLIFNSLPL